MVHHRHVCTCIRGLIPTFDNFRAQFKDALMRLKSKTGLKMTASKSDEKELRTLFESIDNNGSGTIEMDEYFIFALDVARSQGCGLEAIFQKYDKTGEGQLDASEFALAVEDLGFSATFAHDLFVDIDEDNSGSVSCIEIAASIKKHVGGIGDSTRKFLTTLAFKDAEMWNESQQVESSTGHVDIVKGDTGEDALERVNKTLWAGKLKGPDSDSLRNQLQEMLQCGGLRNADLYNLLVMPLVKGDATQTLTRDVFCAGIKRLGYCGPPQMLMSLFKKIDSE